MMHINRFFLPKVKEMILNFEIFIIQNQRIYFKHYIKNINSKMNLGKIQIFLDTIAIDLPFNEKILYLKKFEKCSTNSARIEV